jgi:hypothetical protein
MRNSEAEEELEGFSDGYTGIKWKRKRKINRKRKDLRDARRAIPTH